MRYIRTALWAVFSIFTKEYYPPTKRPRMKNILLYVMAIAYIGAGLNHLINPDGYMRIMPPWPPYPLPLVYISGVCEMLFALLLFPAATRHVGAWLIIVLLVAVFPANIQMTINYYRHHNPSLWVTILRLPLQIVLIWWAWVYTR
jgi:uncharacterized membrane protein